MSERLWLVVPAAGRGRRMGGACPKQYLTLGGRTIMARTLSRLHAAFPEARLLLCLDSDDKRVDAATVPFAGWRRVDGGAERADTVSRALAAIADEADAEDLVLVHDVARPCVHPDDLTRLRAALVDEPVGALLAAPVADTMKRADGVGRVAATEPREGLWHALTPQGFRFGLLQRALAHARREGLAVTDESSAVEALGLSPRLVAGRRDNLKITHPEDLGLAALILAAQDDEASRTLGETPA
ncbi:2-C-methyl-D-erythritol 4-phosphate cytidylyltransferase [Modicisalibacter coralii]|uniref:2-C-methyl-D-erythritol 4-phosphate cytidylyltransferase n=1 Tax=Modicisalibacter coralii TaxID=2304602 RepID=UPI00100C2E7C|nr:2-C-methyl-D-erythritol 4-phosphate cytidylyltransferase [Halomonas coralii]